MLVWDGTISTATGASRLSVLKKKSTNSLAFDPSPVALDLDSFKAKRFLPKPQVDLAGYSPVTTNGSIGVSLQGFGSTGNVTLDSNCLVALNWPVQM